MQSLRSILQNLLFVAVALSAVAGVFLYLSPKPCATPITFSINTIDSRFNIPKSTVTAQLEEVEAMWNSALPGVTPLQFVETGGDVTISFVYDERQRTTIRNERLKRQIAEQKSTLSNLRSTLSATQEQYEATNKKIQEQTTAYLARLNAYKEEVAMWNEKGGAPGGVYEKLKQEQLALEIERINLNNDIADLNKLADAIKNESGKHNAIVQDVNEKVDTVNETAMKEFEEGTYDPNTKTITIYEFESPLSLKRVLAHELGHALDIGHVDGKDSIMYPYNDSDTFALSLQDINALKTICHK
jgi:predicted  nucleic acid-binding Zn-ribbon protein